MSAEIFTVYTVNLMDAEAKARYEKTLHKEIPQSCTNRSIIYNVLGVSSFVANQLKKVMNNEDYDFSVSFCYNDYSVIRIK